MWSLAFIFFINLIYFVNTRFIQELNLSFLIDEKFYSTRKISKHLIQQSVDHLNDSINMFANLNVKYFNNLNLFHQLHNENCKNETLIISMLTCKDTIKLYRLIENNCKSTILLSLNEPSCKRPNLHQGIAFPIINKKEHSFISLLIDLKLTILKQWSLIGLIYDTSIDLETIKKINDGFNNLNEPDIYFSKIIHFELNANLTNINEFLNYKQNTLNKFIVLADSKIIYQLLMKLQKLNALLNPKQWLIIFTDNPKSYLLQRISSILYASDVSIILRQINETLEPYCNFKIEKCQFEFLVETFLHALKIVILNKEYNLNNYLKLKTKNRMLSEMRKYLDVSNDEIESNLDKIEYEFKLNNKLMQNQPKTNLDLIYKLNRSEEKFKNNLYCGRCSRYELKSFERKVILNKKKKNSSNGKEHIFYEEKIFYNHDFPIFMDENDHHIKNIYKNALDAINLHFKTDRTNDLSVLEQQFNNIYDTHKKIRIKRDSQLHEIKSKTDIKWTSYKGITEQIDPSLINIGSLTGKHLRIGIVSQKPFINVEIDESGNCIVNGTTFNLINILMEKLNLTYEWICSKNLEEEGIGHYDNDRGIWTGILGLIAMNKIDLAANGFYRTPSRLQSNLFTFTKFFDEEVIKLLVKKTKEDNEWLFLSPFTYNTWFCIVFTIFISILSYILHEKSKYYEYYNIRENDGIFKLGSYFWYTFGAVIQQAGDYLPKACSSRVLIVFWWLFIIVTISTYSGNLIALLTFPKIIQPIENINDLLNYNSISWALGKHSQIHEVLNTLKYGELTKLKSKMQYLDFNVKRNEIFKQIEEGYLSYLMPESEARYWISKEYTERKWCGMFVAKDTIFKASLHLILSKAQPNSLVKKINQQIYYFTRSGLIKYWRYSYEPLPNDCMYPFIVNAGDVKQIKMVHATGSFYMLIVGIIISYFVLILEYLYYFFFMRNKESNNLKQRNAFIRWLTCETEDYHEKPNSEKENKNLLFTTNLQLNENVAYSYDESIQYNSNDKNQINLSNLPFEVKRNLNTNLYHRPKIFNKYSISSNQYSNIYWNLSQNYNSNK